MSFLRSLFKGWMGEVQTKLAQRIFLDPEQYHVFNNVLIQEGPRATQIDHIIVSKYGVFVVETKNMDGWLYGSGNDDRWTQVIFKKRVRFQNPLRQNYRHTRSLAESLQINHDKMHSLVIFWGNCKFKTQMPENVICRGYRELPDYVKSKKRILLTDDEVNRICDQLQTRKAHTPFLSGWRHVSSLKKRYGNSTVCPRCGGKLLERTAQKGRGAGDKFIGCENYPRCRYTKALKPH